MSVSCPEARVPPHQDSSVRTTGSTELTIRELKNITPAVQSDSKYIKRARSDCKLRIAEAELCAEDFSVRGPVETRTKFPDPLGRCLVAGIMILE